MPDSRPAGQSHQYQIRLAGHLNAPWQEWFDGMSITLDENGDSLLTGEVIDQAALFGLLKKIREISIPLISINRIDDEKDA